MDNLKLKSGSVLLVVSVVIVVVVLAGGAFWYFRYYQKNPQVNQTPSKNTATPISLLDYSNSTYKISIKYPSNWEKREGVVGSVVAFLSPPESSTDIFRENVNIIAQDLSSQKMTLDEFTQLSLEQLPKAIKDYKLVDSKDTELSGNPAKEIEYSGAQNNDPVQLLQFWTIKDNKAYIITYAAEKASYDKFLATVQSMVASFSINE